MEDKIYDELKQIRRLLAELIGSSHLPASQRFSKDAIAKAAKEYQKLAIERGEWVDDVSKVIKNAPWHSGKLIIEKFGFTNYFTRGKKPYFNRKDLVALAKELKERNINLKQYSVLLEDKAKFQKYISSINLPKGTKTKKHFKIPENLSDIQTKPYSAPAEELVRNEIETLLEDYKKFDLSEYVDLYDGKTHGMFKYYYAFDRYVKPEIKKYCKDWCFKFNYANTALKAILEIKSENEAAVQS